MTRKHFEDLAHALAETRPLPGDYADTHNDRIAYEAARLTWEAARRRIADACSASNGRFDRGRFERACER